MLGAVVSRQGSIVNVRINLQKQIITLAIYDFHIVQAVLVANIDTLRLLFKQLAC